MLRFINIKGQIADGNKDFAWYDTVTDTFLNLSGSQVWSSWGDFVEDLFNDSSNWKKHLKRFKGLTPMEVLQC